MRTCTTHVRSWYIYTGHHWLHGTMRFSVSTLVHVNCTRRSLIIAFPSLIANAAITDGIIALHTRTMTAQFSRSRSQTVHIAPGAMNALPARETLTTEKQSTK